MYAFMWEIRDRDAKMSSIGQKSEKEAIVCTLTNIIRRENQYWVSIFLKFNFEVRTAGHLSLRLVKR